ncbi:Holliday junction resolvase RuvX [Patescibacteria group bacterium]|jgi:RNase H-fold protein (predicted Holliday junction resolvase)|nr:Holliday junction resolvase RuvX [Patescibacteria group bacterium]
MRRNPTVLGIDRGSKYIGLAYMTLQDRVPLPIGYIFNDKMTYISIADMIIRYQVNTIVIGRPSQQKDIQTKIQQFVDGLWLLVDPETVKIEYIEEDYSSVQAGEIVSSFKKNVAEDTISAMILLDRWSGKSI